MTLDRSRLTMRGPAGELRVGYETAACLGQWTLVQDDGGWSLSAPVIHRNMFWLTSGKQLDLCLTVGRSTWRFRNVSVTGDDPLTVLGDSRPEIR